MKYVLVALSVAGLLLAGCGKREATKGEEFTLNLEKVAENRSTIVRCADEWRVCNGGFVSDKSDNTIYQIVVDDSNHRTNSDVILMDQIRSSRLQAMVLQNAETDTYLSQIEIALPGTERWVVLGRAYNCQKVEVTNCGGAS